MKSYEKPSRFSSFGQWLAHYRETNRYSMRELAELIGKSHTFVSNLEKDVTPPSELSRRIPKDIINTICEILDGTDLQEGLRLGGWDEFAAAGLVREARAAYGNTALLIRDFDEPEATIPDRPSDPLPRRWTRDEYYHMAEAGILAPDERTELIDGEVMKMSPQGSRHAVTAYKISHLLEGVLPPGFCVFPDRPIVLADDTEPEPDIAVVAGIADDYEDHHPRPEEILLLIEVSDTTLSFDRRKKAKLYSRAGIIEYWIVNLQARQVETYRDPVVGSGYRVISLYFEGDELAPQAFPATYVQVNDMLPSMRKPDI